MTSLFPSSTSPDTSGTYQFRPSNMEVIASAYARIGIRRTQLETQQIQDGVAELNLFLASFNTAGPNLAQIDTQTITLVQGTATYDVAPETVMITDAVLTYTSGGTDLDVYMYPLSRTEYVAIPNKAIQARPNQYFYDRQAMPQVTLYPTPDGNGPYEFNFFRFRQVQDSTLANGVQPEVPNRAIDAVVAGLAYRLARIYAPQLEGVRKADAGEAWALYAKQDTENTPLYLVPGLAGYWRQ